MSEILVNLIIQAIGGAIGGNAVGATLKNMNLGTLGNTIAGALGGAGGGSILSALIPALSGGAGGSISVPWPDNWSAVARPGRSSPRLSVRSSTI
jgi:hypothetical protein